MPVLNVPYTNRAVPGAAATDGVAWAAAFTLNLWDRTPGGAITVQHFANGEAFATPAVESRTVPIVPRPGKLEEFFAANPAVWNAIQAFLDVEIQAYFGEGQVTPAAGPPEWASTPPAAPQAPPES